MTVANRLVSGEGVLLLAVVAFILVGCASKQVSSLPAAPQDETYEHGTPDAVESAQQSEGGEQAGESSEPNAESETGPPPGSPTSGELGSGLDRQLDESLREFEDRLRREQEALAGHAAGGEESPGSDAGGGTGTGEGAPPDPPGGAGTSSSGESDAGRTPAGIPDGSDDDIVARQLREMAEAEEDPELRAIYWQEYLDYKNGKRTEDKDEGN